MSTSTLLQKSHRWLLTLVVATVIAVSASYAPVLLDKTAGTNLTTAAYACSHPSGGC